MRIFEYLDTCTLGEHAWTHLYREHIACNSCNSCSQHSLHILRPYRMQGDGDARTALFPCNLTHSFNHICMYNTDFESPLVECSNMNFRTNRSLFYSYYYFKNVYVFTACGCSRVTLYVYTFKSITIWDNSL